MQKYLLFGNANLPSLESLPFSKLQQNKKHYKDCISCQDGEYEARAKTHTSQKEPQRPEQRSLISSPLQHCTRQSLELGQFDPNKAFYTCHFLSQMDHQQQLLFTLNILVNPNQTLLKFQRKTSPLKKSLKFLFYQKENKEKISILIRRLSQQSPVE